MKYSSRGLPTSFTKMIFQNDTEDEVIHFNISVIRNAAEVINMLQKYLKPNKKAFCQIQD